MKYNPIRALSWHSEPVWYSIAFLNRITVGGEVCDRELCVNLVKACSYEQARERGMEVARSNESEYKNSEGQTVCWEFDSLLDVWELMESSLADGCEVYSAFLDWALANELKRITGDNEDGEDAMDRPKIDESCLILIDQQERLVNVIDRGDRVTARQAVMLQGALELGLDVLLSEQYPKGLGRTVPELAKWLPEETPIIEKTSFSVFGEPAFRSALRQKSRHDLFIGGIETHICVFQSVLDALADGYRVWVLADAVGSRSAADRECALQAMRQLGARIIPVESALFLLLGDAGHPKFKAVSALIK